MESGENSLINQKMIAQSGVMLRACNPNTQGAEAGGWQEFEASLGYTLRFCFKTQTFKDQKIEHL